MFRRSKSFTAKNSNSNNTVSISGAAMRSTTSSSPLRLFRRTKHHRRSQSADDAKETAHAVATAAAAQIKAEQEELLPLRRSDLQVGRLLGQGGFAQVFAVSIKTKTNKPTITCGPTRTRKLALKQLRPDLIKKDKKLHQRAAQALVKEARIMTLLQGHRHILPIRGVSSTTTTTMDPFFLVIDALQETMTDRVQRWNTTAPTQQRWMDQLQYALQVAQALAYCHEHRIVYRDCKVDNLGFKEDGTVQLFDFGLARELPDELDFDDAQTCTSSLDERYGGEEVFHMTICGTQRHMAPEVYHRGWYNCKADVYSWAMTVVELVTGKKPYPYMSLPVHKILVLEGGGRPNLEGFPTGLRHILNQAWALSLEDRWSMAQVCAALETYIGSECSRQAVQQDAKSAPLVLHDQARANNLNAVAQQQPEAVRKPVLAGAA